MAAVDRIEAKNAPDITNDEPGETRYLHFPRSEEVNGTDGKPMLNRYSTYITREHDFPGAQVRLNLPYYKFLPASHCCKAVLTSYFA
jgi:hypothetical protein